jgi:hypothetical protein
MELTDEILDAIEDALDIIIRLSKRTNILNEIFGGSMDAANFVCDEIGIERRGNRTIIAEIINKAKEVENDAD